MKKLSVLFLTLLLLVGCTNASIESTYFSGLSQALPVAANNTKPYYRYYLPPHVGVRAQDQTSSILMVDGHEILMNLMVQNIVSKTFEYEAVEKNIKKTPIFEEETTYIDLNGNSQNMNVRVYELNTGELAIFVDNQKIELVSVVLSSSVNITLETMIIILKSTEVFDDKVVLAYSNKQISKNSGTYSEFFEQVPPETGTLREMYDSINPDNQ